MKAMICISNAMVALLVLSFQCALLAQLPLEPPSKLVPRFPSFPSFQPETNPLPESAPQPPRRVPAKLESYVPEFGMSLVKPNENDDEIKTLQRQQLAEAFHCVHISAAMFDSGSSLDVSMTNLHKYLNLATIAAFSLAETTEKKVECLEFVIKTTKRTEQIAAAHSTVGRSRLNASDAKYWRLEAEINLLKFKRDSALEK